MSKNYELLQQVAKQKDFFPPHSGLQPKNASEELEPHHHYDTDLKGVQKEEITNLVRQLFLLSEPVSSRSVVFSSLEQGSGCSWIISRAARVLASSVEGSVCLVDGNLRAPTLHKEFELCNDYGLANAALGLAPAREFAQRISGGNLWVMTAGSLTNGQTVTPDGIYPRISELRKDFNYLIVDSPALNACSDAAVLGSHSDGLVLVLKANVSRRDTAHRALRDLSAAHVNVLGSVLNQRTFPLPDAIYKRL